MAPGVLSGGEGASAAELPCELAAVAARAVHGPLELSAVHSADDGVAGERQACPAHLPHARRRAGGVGRRSEPHLLLLCDVPPRARLRRCVLLLDEGLRVDVDVDDVAVVQLVARRLLRAVDEDLVRAQRVGAVGELRGGVGERRALRQVEDAAVAREDEDAGAEELLADELHELVGVLDVVVPVADDLQPRQRRRPRPLLVRPVRRRAVLGDRVHPRGADLHLEGLRADEDGGVQRAVAVGLRARDVVLQRARQRRPPRVDLAEHVEAEGVLVALGELLLALGHLRVQHDAEGDEVVDPLDAVPEGRGAASENCAGIAQELRRNCAAYSWRCIFFHVL